MEILFVFGIPAAMVVLLVWIKNRERIKRYEMQADLYAKALEKGEKIPDNLFEPAYLKYDAKEDEREQLSMLKRNSLNVGLICMFAGIAVSLFFWFAAFFIGQIDDVVLEIPFLVRAVAAIGIIPFLIGVAFVIIHFIGKKKEN